MYFVERGGGRQWLGVGGYITFVTLYLLIQAFTRFQHPLHGAVVVFLLAVFYALAMPGWVHARVADGPNPASPVDGGIAFLFTSDRLWPAATDRHR